MCHSAKSTFALPCDQLQSALLIGQISKFLLLFQKLKF